MPWHRHPVKSRGVDPHCIAYKRIFDEINDRFNKEMYESPMHGDVCVPFKIQKGSKTRNYGIDAQGSVTIKNSY